MTAIADAIAKAGYKPERDLLYVALQRFYGACDGKDFLPTVEDLARQVENDMSGKSLPPREGNGHPKCASLGHAPRAIPPTVSEVHAEVANGQCAHDLRKPFEQEQSPNADGPRCAFPAQSNSMGHPKSTDNGHSSGAHRTPNGGNGQPRFAVGQTSRSVAAVPKEPTASQIAAQASAKTALARSLFDKVWLGKAVGSWSYRSLLSIDRDGQFARALRAEIGEIAEGDMDMDVRSLLGGNEMRLRKVMIGSGRLLDKAE